MLLHIKIVSFQNYSFQIFLYVIILFLEVIIFRNIFK